MDEKDGLVIARLPDGSGAFVGSFPLPKDHWLTDPKDDEQPVPILSVEGGHDASVNLRRTLIERARWAVRATTMKGKITDFDPDAMVQNIVSAIVGTRGSTVLPVRKR